MPQDIEMEASELGLAPGVWPDEITHEGKTYTAFDWNRDEDGQMMVVFYRGPKGHDGTHSLLSVYND